MKLFFTIVASTTSTLENTDDSIDDSEDGEILGNGPETESKGHAEAESPRMSKYAIEKRGKFHDLTSNVTISWELAPQLEVDDNQRKISKGQGKMPSDFTLQRAPFVIDDFIVCTKKCSNP